MAQTNENLVQCAYAAFNGRNLEAGLALMDPDVAWPNVPEGGFVHGHEEVREHWRQQFGQVDPRIEIGDVTTRDDGRVEAQVRQIVLGLDGTELSDDQLIHVFTIDDGLIKQMQVESGIES